MLEILLGSMHVSFCDSGLALAKGADLAGRTYVKFHEGGTVYMHSCFARGGPNRQKYNRH